MFGSSLFLTIYALSLVRLEISLSPFRFQAHNHAHLATLLLTLILAIPVGEAGLRLLVQGYFCDCSTFLLIKGLYGGQQMAEQGACSQVYIS